MDKTELKSELLKVAAAFEAEGRPLEVAGIVQVLTFDDYSFQVYAPWLNSLSRGQAIDAVIDKVFALLPPEALRLFNRVEICVKPDDIRCLPQDIIVNRINFQPLVVPYSVYLELLQMQH